ncbi:hypothetical protein Vretimale_3642 [Volvox reticuliferus]|uniref:Protein kinase domain-containing protein n=1 Tax=Volvox reticuliferus TaxID=1737510 RepID=A0A8J4G3R2_9CHLO|nr:hypothetical protein Vretimale_3642 [Volvox reticuliferus]
MQFKFTDMPSEHTCLAVSALAGPSADFSSAYARALVEPALAAPPALDDLRRFLAQPPDARIPIIADVLNFLQLSPDLRRCFVGATGRLAIAVAISLSARIQFGNAKIWTAMAENTVLISLLMELDKVLPPDCRVGLVPERDHTDPSLMVAQGGSSLRSDGVLRDTYGRRMLAKWEDTAANMQAAVAALHKKTAVWTPLYYGDIEYLPCFAAAGNLLQFYCIAKGDGVAGLPRDVSPVLDLTYTNDRAWAVITAVKFYQLLRAQCSRYPYYVLRAGDELCARHDTAGFKRSIFFRTDILAVHKRVYPWSDYEEWSGVCFKDLQELYRATANCQGVVHAVQGAPTLVADKYSVDLVPVGLQPTVLSTEEEARCMAGGLLQGLAAIHEAGFVHRDVRWDNFVCSPEGRRWFLIDLETCARANQQPKDGFQLFGWQSDITLVEGRYTCASDLYQLGLVFNAKCGSLLESEAGKEFLNAILTQPIDQRLSAVELLRHEWLR